jgi:hypothetical protein
MSLIQEALKRREEEKEGLIGDAEAAGPDTIPGPPPREPLGRQERAGRGWVALFSVLLAILILLGAALALLFYVIRSLPDSESRIEVAENLPPDLPEQPPVREPIEPVATADRDAVPEAVVAEKTRAASERTPPADTSSPEQTLAVLSAPVSESPGAMAVPSAEPAPELSVPAEPEPVLPTGQPSSVRERSMPPETADAVAERDPGAWPELDVTGVLTKRDPSLSTAIINKEIVGVNEQINGVTILEVEAYGVWAEYGDETRYLRVGRKVR